MMEESDYSPIMEIPREIRGIIFSNVPQSHRVHNLRLVCSQWRTEVDDLCSFSAQIDSQQKNWERVFQLRLHTCHVIDFLKPPPNGPGTSCLKFPNLLKNLTIMTDKISALNLFYLLSDSAGSLTHLCLQLNFPLLLGESFPSSLADIKFNRLLSLELTVCTLRNKDGELRVVRGMITDIKDSQTPTFDQLMINRMVSVKDLKIELNVLSRKEVSKMSAAVLNFIGHHWRSLECLNFELMQGHGLPTSPLFDSDLEKIDFELLEKVRGLKYLRIISSSPLGVDKWIDLIENQCKLQYFEADILPVPASVFENMILRNEASLVQCEITDLTVWDSEGQVTPFDLSFFQNCLNLRKLVLDRNVGGRRGYECAELISLYNLPSGLKDLALNYFNVCSEEFLLFFNCPTGHNLRNLTLNQCGNGGPFGINGSVLETIVSLPNIFFIEISTFNYSDVEENRKLNRVLVANGYAEGHSYFQYNRFLVFDLELMSLSVTD